MLSSIRPLVNTTQGKVYGALNQGLPQIRRAAATQQLFSTSSSNRKDTAGILLQDKENGFGFARSNPRPSKPRSKGVTEIRGPYYSVRSVEIKS